MLHLHRNFGRCLPDAYIDEGVYFNVSENEVHNSSYIFYPTRRSKDGLKTYIDSCSREDRKAMVLPKW
jgi:hypothetical protein